MNNKVIIAISVAITVVAFCTMVWIVEDIIRMEVALRHGLEQCEGESSILWKKSCN